MSNCYVYIVFRPWNCEPAYVGFGRGTRANRAALGHRNPHLRAILKRAAGARLPVAIIREGLSKAEAEEIEVALIAVLGRADKGTGPLTNHTDGGDGGRGNNRPKSPEHRAKIAAANRGQKRDPETRAKISAAMMGRKASPERREKLRQIARLPRAPCSEERKQKIAAANRGKTTSAHQRATVSKIMKGVPKSAEHRAKIGAALKKRYAHGHGNG